MKTKKIISMLLITTLLLCSIFTVASASYGGYRIGDINKDGVVDYDDFSLIVNYIEGSAALTSSQYNLADCDRNGVVDYDDADIVLRLATYVLGDVLMDGNLNTGDAVRVLRYLNGLETLSTTQKLLADYNQDNVVTQADVEAILTAVAAMYKVLVILSRSV